ncbi:2-C-methyl-D-erythritol 4-phosphate cytidylyltransferase [Candidatus Omnitrophus magneticus]|uniref:2-C-methyl-D-erythritol 4-phosphate cytidylyltransferase n=1 Tax=Candidatus Omnitrophus magneticus TaxID=1609969 RepID=A0A0F0CUE7_9BACT|nr:2-C-methyl-D-erythritol 4-phosphate cytidylyltransferase [Candidatus Omnitrophus magneticus]
MQKKITGIILAGGKGERAGGALPKQFILLNRKPLLLYSLEKFQANPLITDIVVVTLKKYISKVEALVKNNNIKKCCEIIEGGETRQESSFLGVGNAPSDTEYVVIHDSARPFVTHKMIEDTITAAIAIGSATTAIEETNTIARSSSSGLMEEVLERKYISIIQTPQAFRYDIIIEAHLLAKADAKSDFTDDAGLVLHYEHSERPIKIVAGHESNIKITNQLDFELAECILKNISK